MKRLLLAVILSITAACATPGQPPHQRTSAAQATDPAGEPGPAGDELLAAREPATEADDPEVGVASVSPAGTAGLEAVEPPQPGETPTEMLPRVNVDEPEVICTREVPTGSRLAVEVCRKVSDVEQRQENDQRLFDQIKTNTTIGTTRF